MAADFFIGKNVAMCSKFLNKKVFAGFLIICPWQSENRRNQNSGQERCDLGAKRARH